MTEKLVEIKDLEISFGEGRKKFVAVRNILLSWRIWVW